MNGLISIIFLFFSATYSNAVEKNSSSEKPKPPISDIVQSGRDHDTIEINRQAVEEVDRALDLLGISRPDHRLEFVPSGELPQLAILGRPAVGHWHDGSIIASQSRSAMGVLEFVTPGCPTCRSFYSDSTTPTQQIEIFKHVGGHNDFAVNSTFCKIRQPNDMIAAAEKLYLFMEDAYHIYDFDEVAQWYQYLLSVQSGQDLSRGTFCAPETFKRDPVRPNTRHPKVSTPHELQFLVYNLPNEIPEWKKEMAQLFEQMSRMMGYMINTKIMNEGWATFVQELLVPYLPWKDHTHVIEAAELRSGVAPAVLSNPYWLGREAWRAVYKKFNKAPELRNLPQLERDQKFVKYAHGLIAQYGDYDFLRIALDEEWVSKHHLFLYRKATENEQDPNLEPSKPNEEQKIVVSTESKEIIDYVAKRIADRTLQIPRILVEDMSATGKNFFSLIHEVVDDVPITQDSAVQAMYIRTQIWNRIVSLKTIAATSWTLKKSNKNLTQFSEKLVEKSHSSEEKLVYPIRIEVDPQGKVAVFRVENSAEIIDSELTLKYQRHLDRFKEELEGMVHEKLEEKQKSRFASIAAMIGNSASQASMDLTSHIPNASTAVMRYLQMIDRRIHRALTNAVHGKAPLRKTQTGVRIRVLPEIPQFELDQKARKALEKRKVSQHIETMGIFRSNQQTYFRDLYDYYQKLVDKKNEARFQVEILGVDLGSAPYSPKKGDRFWGDPENESQGESEDDEDGSEEELGEEGKKKNQPGEGEAMDPAEVEVSLEQYGEFLNLENIELPHLRPKAGQSLFNDIERDGGQRRQNGDILWNRIAPRILELGTISYQKKGINPKNVNSRKLFNEGLKYLQPGDWIVPGVRNVTRPEVNAVIVLWMDMTGSMIGKPIQMAKQFIFNLKALLSTKYKQIVFRYVGFSDKAVEFPTEEKFFKAFISGGTDYAVGIEKTRSILSDYDTNIWDKFSFGIGDLEDMNPFESVKSLQELVNETQYSAFIQTDIGNNVPQPILLKSIKELADDEKNYFGYGTLHPKAGSGIEVIRQLLGKNK